MGLLILLIALGVFINTMENFYCKNLLKTRCDSFVYSIIYFLVAVITTFIYNGCRVGKMSTFLVLDSLLYGSMLTLELYCTLQAYKCGSMSLTSMFIMASIMIPIIPSWIFWGDKITWNQVVGIAVMFAAIALILNVGADIGKTKLDWKWFMYAFFAFIGSGTAAIAEKLLTVSEYVGQTNDFVLMGLMFSVIFMGIVLLVLRKKEPITIKMNARVILPTAVTGVGYSFLCIITLLVVAILPASVVYTVSNGAKLILITIIDVLLFKEKITKPQYLGLGLGVVGVVLLSLA